MTNIALLLCWLVAAALCVAYVTDTGRRTGLELSALSLQHRDRPLRSWGPYLPREVTKRTTSPKAIAEAPHLGVQNSRQRVIKTPHPPAAPLEVPTGSGGAEDDHGALNLKPTGSKLLKPKAMTKLPDPRNKVAKGPSPNKERSARRGKGGNQGLWALSRDPGRFYWD
jgi:hypothetical protein